MFSPSQKWILLGCAVVIVVGLGILAIDKFFVRGDQPDPQIELQEVATTLQMQPVSSESERHMLAELLQRWPELAGRDPDIQSALKRQFEGATLWAFDLSSQAEAIRGAQGVRHDVAVGHLGIVIRLDDSPALPPWSSLSGEPAPMPPYTEDALAKLARMDEFAMATVESDLLFVSRSEGWALLRATERSTSAEFQPGLRNSALRIDLQRAIDVANALSVDTADIPPIYRITVETNIQVNLDTGISERMQEVVDAAEAQRLERQQTQQAQAAANAAAREALSADFAESQRINAEQRKQRSDKLRAEREARQREQREEMHQRLERMKQVSEQAQQRAAEAVEQAQAVKESDGR